MSVLPLRLALSSMFLLGSLCAACGSVVVEDDHESSGGGGDGATVGEACPASTQEVCYTGPAGTEGVGNCEAGVRYCPSTGFGWTECVGEVVPRAEVCSTAADESCDGVGECTGAGLWARDLATDEAEGSAEGVAVDGWGDVLVTGTFLGKLEVAGLSLESEEHTAFVLKLDGQGNGLWARQAKGAAGGVAVAVDGDGNVLVAGGFWHEIDLGGGPLSPVGPEDVFVAKYDRAGGLLWSRGFGGAGFQWPTGMAVDGEGNALIVGGLHDGSDFGEGYAAAVGETDLFVLKIDAAGEKMYSKRFGSKGYDYGLGIAATKDGAAVITGSFSGTMGLGGAPLETAGSDDVFLAWLSPAGEHVWSRRFGGEGPDLGKGIAVDANGVIGVAGLSTGTVDFGGGALVGGGLYDAFVAFYGSDGEALGARVFGGSTAITQALAVAADGAGSFVVTGEMSGTMSFGEGPLTAAGAIGATDAFLVKLGPDGQPVYGHLFGDGQTQAGSAVGVDVTGNVVVAGSFRGAIDFGTGPLAAPSSGTPDLFVAKLLP